VAVHRFQPAYELKATSYFAFLYRITPLFSDDLFFIYIIIIQAFLLLYRTGIAYCIPILQAAADFELQNACVFVAPKRSTCARHKFI
jgi:hypothetical protein